MKAVYEREFKCLIKESEYNRIVKYITWNRHIVQTNYYYDTCDYSFFSKGYTCRIRVVEDEIEIQIKEPNISKNQLYKKRKEQSLSLETYPNMEIIEIYFNAAPLTLLGSLTTERYTYQYDENIIIFVDKNYYLDKVDYELEIEFKENRDIKKVKKILNEDLTISEINKDCKGKYTRFIFRYLELKGQ